MKTMKKKIKQTQKKTSENFRVERESAKNTIFPISLYFTNENGNS